MAFYDILEQAQAMLRHNGRVSYRALRRAFEIDDAFIADLKTELIDVLRVAREEGGVQLVWVGAEAARDAAQPAASSPAAPSTPSTPSSPATLAAPSEAARRYLTVMVCGLVDAPDERLDPEQQGEVHGAWQDACTEVIQSFGGYIAENRGDGLFVYFGYPVAFEDGAQRAMRCGLTMLERLPGLNARLQASHGVQVALRIGVHSGPVLLGDRSGRAGRERPAVGETPQLAVRVQALAGRGELLASDSAQLLARGFFDFEDLGERMAGDTPHPLHVYRVLRETRARDRLDALPPGALVALVARESELGWLRERWALAMEGHGRVVMLSGEAGIGKSRLVAELRVLAETAGARRVVLRCSPYHSASALHPVVEHLQRLLRFEPQESAASRLAKLRAALEASQLDAPQRLMLLAQLLSLPVAEAAGGVVLNPRERREQTIEALVDWVLRDARREPLLVVCEDLHWADPSLLELLQRVVEEMTESRLMVLMTFRPEFRPPWPGRSHVSQITLGRLSDAEALSFAQRALRGRTLAPAVLQQVIARADGIPLFIEELIAALLEAPAAAGDPAAGADGTPLAPAGLSIPSTLQGSLMARLDRLAEVREIAQIGAAAGREFAYELIHAAAPGAEAELRAGLDKLVESELLQRRGTLPHAVYRFRHALIRDAAYESMLRSQRQQVHRKIAQAIEQRFAATLEAQPELVARHYSEAGDPERAIPLWQRAGERALNRCANEEALSHLDRALALLATRADTPQRAQRELQLQVARGAVLLMARGQSAPEVEQAYSRARALGAHARDPAELFPALLGLWRFHVGRGELEPAREVAEQMLSSSEQLSDTRFLLIARMTLGITLYHLWEMPRALELVRAGAEQYEREPPSDHDIESFSLGQHPGLGCCLAMSFILWHSGLPDQSLAWQDRALALGRRLGSPFQLVSAYGWSALVAYQRRDEARWREHIETAWGLAEKHRFPLWTAVAQVHRGALRVADGAFGEGLALCNDGVAMIERLSYNLVRVRALVVLAEACAKAGRPEEGIEAVRQGLEVHDRYCERWWQPELHRLRGELLLQAGRGSHEAAEAAEVDLREALRVARQRGLRLFGLRAATSLARLLGQRGERAQAQPLLAQTMAGWREGFEMADWRAARAVADSL